MISSIVPQVLDDIAAAFPVGKRTSTLEEIHSGLGQIHPAYREISVRDLHRLLLKMHVPVAMLWDFPADSRTVGTRLAFGIRRIDFPFTPKERRVPAAG